MQAVAVGTFLQPCCNRVLCDSIAVMHYTSGMSHASCWVAKPGCMPTSITPPGGHPHGPPPAHPSRAQHAHHQRSIECFTASEPCLLCCAAPFLCPPCRADGQGTSYELPWTRGWSGVSDGFTPTVEPITEFGVYKMKPYGKKEGCAAWACDQFKGMFVYSFKWKLPAGYKCEQCMLMHYYLTASRCWPTCNGGNCKKPVIYANCGAPGATYPEE